MARNRNNKTQDVQPQSEPVTPVEPEPGADAPATQDPSADEHSAEPVGAECVSIGDDAAPPSDGPAPAETADAPTEPDASTDDQTTADQPTATPAESAADLALTDASAGEISTERVVEAILFSADQPLTPAKIVSILGTGSAREVRKIIHALNAAYAETGRAFRAEEIAGGYQILTLPEYNTWLRRLRQSRQESKLSPAAMETLAVVAYKQPVVRADIEAVRGVSVGEVLNRLRELGLVKIVGRADDVGRPMLYGTTKHFLQMFGLGTLDDLPAIQELQMPQ